MPTIAELLETSRAAHADYRRNITRKQANRGKVETIEGNPVAARAALERAANARKAAQDADPKRTDPAWAVDEAQTGGHDHLMTFYAETLARE